MFRPGISIQGMQCHNISMEVSPWSSRCKNMISHFDKHVQNLICVVYKLFQLLDIMGSLLERELIKKDFDEKYPLIVKMIDKELDMAKGIYDEQMAAKKEGGKAVLHKNMPKVSGSLRWAQELRERITAPMGNFKALDHR